MSEHTFSEANVLALWQNRAITSQHAMPNRGELDAFLEKREHPKFPAVPEHMAMLDVQGYVFVLERPEADAMEVTQWGWDHGGRGPSAFPTLEAAVKNAYWVHIGLYGRIREVQKAGIKVEPASLGEGVHYWRFERGNRVSALFPTEEAAWLDAIRVHENAVERVKADPGIHRVRSRSAEESRELSILKRLTNQAGYEYSCDGVSNEWRRGGQTVKGFKSRADAIRAAIRNWASVNPDDFAVKMNSLGLGETVLQSPEDSEAISHMIHKSSGLTFAQLQKAQGFPADWMTEPDEAHLFGMQKALEHDGYGFDFTASRGWIWSCDGEQGQGSGAKATAVKDAWKHAIANGTVEKDLASVALGYARDYINPDVYADSESETAPDVVYVSPPCQHHAGFPDIAEPERWPKPGTRVMVRPHNAVWGFPNVDPVLCDIRGYWGDWVWFQRVGTFCSNDAFVTTRIDKCEIELAE
jgi:hypothetical protein